MPVGVSEPIRMDCAVVFWSVGQWTNLEALNRHMGDAGFGDCVPERRAFAACLRDALTETLGGPKTLIRPLEGKDGFAVLLERRGREANDYEQVMRARLLPVQGADPTLDVHPWTEHEAKVRTAYFKHQGLLGAGQVGACMVRAVEKLGGTRLRPNGGVYWLPHGQVQTWNEAAAALEGSAANGCKNVSYILRHRLDADAVKAVRDAITGEITAEAQRLKEEIMGGELGARALDGRSDEAERLIAKAAEYERLLGVGLEALKQAGLEAKRAATVALLKANAAAAAQGQAAPV